MPSTNENTLPTAKLRSAKARRSTIGCPAVSTRKKNTAAAAADTTAAERNRRILEPVVARPFLEHVFERAEKQRHGDEADPVELLEQLEIGLVEIDQRDRRDGDDDAGHDVDEEQPVPGERFGQDSRRRSGRWSAPASPRARSAA